MSHGLLGPFAPSSAGSFKAPHAAHPPSVGKGESSVRILIVEDEYLIGSELETGLLTAGFDVVGWARTADQAVAIATAQKPDLIVMDVQLMGPRDGVDAALEIFRKTGIRSLFASAHADVHTRGRALAAEPLGWVSKPYAVHSVVDLIERALRADG
jgi:DNA-binding response OmpR family regulator